MSRFRSYFSKNNTIIRDNPLNIGRNPVTEIFYGTDKVKFSRFIFKIDLEPLITKITGDSLTQSHFSSHTLNLTNTIKFTPNQIGGQFSDCITKRASSFDLVLYNISDETWDEGNKFDFVADTSLDVGDIEDPSNWFYRKLNTLWNILGIIDTGDTIITGITGTGGTVIILSAGTVFTGTSGNTISGGTPVIAEQTFDQGNEDVYIDLTTHINDILFGTGTTEGLVLALKPSLENLNTAERMGVGFHTRFTNTFYEPYLESLLDDNVLDDRNYFFQNKANKLYLYSKVGYALQNIDVTGGTGVTIQDDAGTNISTIPSSAITQVQKGIYSIDLTLDETNSDCIIYKDIWDVTVVGKQRNVEQEFYLIPENQYINFDLDNIINTNNISFTYVGIHFGEKIRRGNVRKVKIKTKKLLSQDNFLPLDIQYRLYVKQGTNQIDVIPFTVVNRTFKGYEFDIDTSWLIPNQYFLETKLSNGDVSEIKLPLNFEVVSEGPITN